MSWQLCDDCSSFALSRENRYRADGTCEVQARIRSPARSVLRYSDEHRICNLIFFVTLFGDSSQGQWISLVQLGASPS